MSVRNFINALLRVYYSFILSYRSKREISHTEHSDVYVQPLIDIPKFYYWAFKKVNYLFIQIY